VKFQKEALQMEKEKNKKTMNTVDNTSARQNNSIMAIPNE
jgi:hypothetical protein